MMKNLFNKIYNAVNEGIQKALLIDPDQNDVSINYSYHKINNAIDLIGIVDLGLSVKWTTRNLGATCGKTAESWYGDYYAWGETKPKSNYSNETYIHWDYYRDYLYNEVRKLKKYNCISDCGIVDNKKLLDKEDDVMAVSTLDIYRLPTKKELDELLDTSKIINEYVTDYKNIKGLNGRLFTSKINSNSIFIPFAGFYTEDLLKDTGGSGHLLSCEASDIIDKYDKFAAWTFDFDDKKTRTYAYYRYYGLSARGVCR